MDASRQTSAHAAPHASAQSVAQVPAQTEDWTTLLDAFAAYQRAMSGLAPRTVATHRTYLVALAR